MTLSKLLLDELKAFNDPVYFCERILNFPLFPMQAKVLREFYDPRKKYNELVMIVGRRGSKTQLASCISCYEAFKLICLQNPARYYHLAKGQEIFIVNVAASKEQARDTVFAAVASKIENSEWFQSQNYTPRYNEFYFHEPKVFLRSDHSNSASLVGRTVKCGVLDELARFKDKSQKSSAKEVYTAVRNSTQTFGREGITVTITSPILVNDFAMQLYYQSQDPHTNEGMLGYKMPTWEMNPFITRESLQPEYDRNPEMAERDFGANPSFSIERYFKEPERITDPAVMSTRKHPIIGDYPSPVFRGKPGFTYVLAGDPSLKNDAFGLVLGHLEKDKIVLDLLHRFKPSSGRELSSEHIKRFIMLLVNHFKIRLFLTDVWHYVSLNQELERKGVKVERHLVTKKDYDFLKELIYTKRIEYYNHPIFIEELQNLELVRNKVDHPRDSSKDIADAAANCCYGLKQIGVFRKPKIFQVRTYAPNEIERKYPLHESSLTQFRECYS